MTVDSHPIREAGRPPRRTGSVTPMSALCRRMCKAAGIHTWMTIRPGLLAIRVSSMLPVIRRTRRQFRRRAAITRSSGQGKPIPTALSIGGA